MQSLWYNPSCQLTPHWELLFVFLTENPSLLIKFLMLIKSSRGDKFVDHAFIIGTISIKRVESWDLLRFSNLTINSWDLEGYPSYLTLKIWKDLKILPLWGRFTQDLTWSYLGDMCSSRISLKSESLIVRYSQKGMNSHEFLLCSVILRILQLLIALEPQFQVRWGFQQNVPLQISTSIKIEKLKCHMFDFRLISVDPITCVYHKGNFI